MRTSETAGLPRRPDRGAAASLFPELTGGERRSVRLAQGLLRAPPRGRILPPCLSALVWEAPHTGLPPGVATPGQVLAERGWESAALLAEAAAARRLLAACRVGGAWWHRGEDVLPAGGGMALVVLAEPAVPESAAAPSDAIIAAMLAAALAENPPDRVMILAPATPGRRLPSPLAAAAARGVKIIAGPVDPRALFDRTVRVYTVGGEIGLLALLAGLPVAAFGSAFYTGWGVTLDAPGVPARPCRRTVDEIFAAACLVATRYRDPFRDRPASFTDTVALLADWRRAEEANRRIAVCVGMSFWKRRRIADFVRSAQGSPVLRNTAAAALAAASGETAPAGAIAGWASRLPDGLAEAAALRGIPLIRVEDGFIRSVGLGSDFLPPASLVFDSRGMYFDPRGPSDLEVLLREAVFEPALVVRAARLAAQLVARGVTKYNLAGDAGGIAAPAGRRRILVPGQVEDDLSILHGAGAVRTNLDLLASVRSAAPDAFIVYKPHPDVLAGHRKGMVPEKEARRFADRVISGGSTPALLAEVDELHTMTSLAGFEALLRGRRVVVYGRPFYAGWGLTTDLVPLDRGRDLTLGELVAGVLILYPRYLDPLTRLPCGPEVIIERLDCPELWRPGPLVRARRLQGSLVRRLAELRTWLPSAGPSAAPDAARGLEERLRH